MTRRVLLSLLLLVAGYFALFGGEYSLFELTRIRKGTIEEAEALRILRVETDSLGARVDSLESDPATLERIARERYGMIRDGEVLYRFAPPPDPPEEGANPEAGEGPR